MKNKEMKFLDRKELILSFFSIVVFIVFAYDSYKIKTLTERIDTLSSDLTALESDVSSTTNIIKENLAKTHNTLTNAINEERQNVGFIAQKIGSYEQQVGTITGTVDTLQKLSKTDKQLLQKYSKVFFLNEYYAPARLEEIPNDYKYTDSKVVKIQADTWPYLKHLIDDSRLNNVTLYVDSGYRSFSEQQALKSKYKIIYGAGTANQFSADQGYSEHQLGTAVDFITTGLGGELDGFDKTAAYNWLLANAYKYGFILSYPKDNKFYVFEPWHWRFVGVKLATDLHNQGKNFYDLDQRNIDEYLVSVF